MKFRLCALGAILAFGPAVAQADVVFDSITGTTPVFLDGPNGGVTVAAQSFYVPGNPNNLNTITLALASDPVAGNSNPTGSAMVFLAPDNGNGGVPGTAGQANLANEVLLGSVLNSSLSTNFNNPTLAMFTVSPAAEAAVASETLNGEFWVILDDTSGGVAGWDYNNGTPLGTGTAGQSFGNNLGGSTLTYNAVGAPPPPGFGPYEMTVTTPEPVSIALLGVGLAGLGVVRRRRR